MMLEVWILVPGYVARTFQPMKMRKLYLTGGSIFNLPPQGAEVDLNGAIGRIYYSENPRADS